VGRLSPQYARASRLPDQSLGDTFGGSVGGTQEKPTHPAKAAAMEARRFIDLRD
jgi:hypothetical protein